MRLGSLITSVTAALAILTGTVASAQTRPQKTSDGRVVLGHLGRARRATVIRKSPSSASSSYYRVKAKDYLVVDSTVKSGWVKILLQNGQFGYAQTAAVEQLPYLVTSKSPGSRLDARSKMADYALNFKGTPYVWGGNDVNRGIDCSGFVKSMYGAIGLKLPRTAAEQALVGTPISRLEDLRKGDRLYFWDAKRGKIGHTGIYLGDGNFVHSSSGHGGVATDYLGSQKWLKILVAARR